MVLYHYAQLVPGDVIAPGNYGRIIAATGSAHQHWAREQALEGMRQNRYPNKPSRLRSNFWCLERRAIDFYRARPGNGGYLYEVKLVEPCSTIHEADFNYLQPLPRLGLSMDGSALLGRYRTGSD